jgi:hypothetical protein
MLNSEENEMLHDLAKACVFATSHFCCFMKEDRLFKDRDN